MALPPQPLNKNPPPPAPPKPPNRAPPDPSARITVPGIMTHPWVTDRGQLQLSGLEGEEGGVGYGAIEVGVCLLILFHSFPLFNISLFHSFCIFLHFF